MCYCLHTEGALSQSNADGGSIGHRQRRQLSGPDFECTSFDNCGDHSFVGVAFEDLTFTDEQRAMCKNDEACLYDLVVTGDEDFAAATLEASEESTRIEGLISENYI